MMPRKGAQTERGVLHYWRRNDGTGGVLKARKGPKGKEKKGRRPDWMVSWEVIVFGSLSLLRPVRARADVAIRHQDEEHTKI